MTQRGVGGPTGPAMNLPADLDRASLPDRGPPVRVAPSKEPDTPAEWVRQNLFSTPLNAGQTLVALLAIGYLGFRLLRWAFFTADWGVVKANLRVYMIGRFPLEEAWRVWASLYLVVALGGFSWAALRPPRPWTRERAAFVAVAAVLVLGAMAYLLDGLRIWVLVLATGAAFAGAAAFGRRASGPRVRRPLILAWLLAFPSVIVLIRGFGGVPPRLWGGFMVNVLVAVVGILLSFPAGILLAIGRRSSLPAIKVFCIGFIELIRGVPLFTLIVFGQFILPLMLPPGTRLVTIVTQMLVFTIFSSAYVAEIVRGGLQGVHEGQYEAARALGLRPGRMMATVVLPQALRATIPAMISHFISLFKDTSLLAALAITELLRAARRASAQLEFIGDVREALLGAAIMFWLVAFSMSRWSQRLERRLGVGER